MGLVETRLEVVAVDTVQMVVEYTENQAWMKSRKEVFPIYEMVNKVTIMRVASEVQHICDLVSNIEQVPLVILLEMFKVSRNLKKTNILLD